MVACVSDDVAKPDMSTTAATVLTPNSLHYKVRYAADILWRN